MPSNLLSADDINQFMKNDQLSNKESTEWAKRVPKVELHLHLEGAIPYSTLWALVQKYGGDPEVQDIDALVRKFEYRDFPHFIETWMWKNNFLQEYEDFSLIAEAVARDLKNQNLRYVEAFFSAPDFLHHGLKTQELVQAIRKGLSKVSGIEIALIGDLVRDYGPERAFRTLSEIHEVMDFGVIGVGIGGSEHEFPPELFTDVFEQSRQFGFRTSAHAGEAAGAKSIWGAVRSLKVDRIGHGTRAFEDPLLLQHLAKHQIPVEMCPLSNVRTGVVKSLTNHPVRSYFDQGILVSINTDDPKMFGNSLALEFSELKDHLGFSSDEIRTLILNSIDSSWLSAERKVLLKKSFREDPDWLE
jgi:adenosine deaminase